MEVLGKGSALIPSNFQSSLISKILMNSPKKLKKKYKKQITPFLKSHPFHFLPQLKRNLSIIPKQLP